MSISLGISSSSQLLLEHFGKIHRDLVKNLENLENLFKIEVTCPFFKMILQVMTGTMPHKQRVPKSYLKLHLFLILMSNK